MKRIFFTIVLFSLLLAACAPAKGPESAPSDATALPTDMPPTAFAPVAPSGQARVLTVMTHDSFSASEGTIQEFEQANNVKITFLKSGDVGAARSALG